MWRIEQGDVRVLPLEDEAVTAVVCDPPYELNFMSKGWDRAGIAFDVAAWREVLRVLKPGGVLMAFGGTRTYHRMTLAIEDAGFEVVDLLMWLYGSGFPKSMDLSKALDKDAGAEREVLSERHAYTRSEDGFGQFALGGVFRPGEHVVQETAPATEAAKLWNGWGTALKPAWEPIVVAVKPEGARVEG